MLKDANQPTVFNMSFKFFFWQKSNPESRKRSIDNMFRGIKNELSADAHVKISPILIKIPDIQPA